MRRRPYGLLWRLALCRAVLGGDLVSARADVTYGERRITTTFVFEEGQVRRWRL